MVKKKLKSIKWVFLPLVLVIMFIILISFFYYIVDFNKVLFRTSDLSYNSGWIMYDSFGYGKTSSSCKDYQCNNLPINAMNIPGDAKMYVQDVSTLCICKSDTGYPIKYSALDSDIRNAILSIRPIQGYGDKEE